MSILTFIDSCVLIAAFRGTQEASQRAFAILDDPERLFASSDFVRLELLPKAVYNKQDAELKFYAEFFQNVVAWAVTNQALTAAALNEGQIAGTSALDALHIAAAASVGAAELVTTETQVKPIHRTKLVLVRSIAT